MTVRLFVVMVFIGVMIGSPASSARPTRVRPDSPPEVAHSAAATVPKEKWPGLAEVDIDFVRPGAEHQTFDQRDHERLAAAVAKNKACSDALGAGAWDQDVRRLFYSSAHFDNCAFEEGLAYIDEQLDATNVHIGAQTELNPGVLDDVMYELGRTLHGIQDFYSHTNYVEMQSTAGRKPDEIIAIWLPAGRARLRGLLTNGLVSGTFLLDGPKRCGAGAKSHAQLAKDTSKMPSGSASVSGWNKDGYTAALDLARLASRSFIAYAFNRWPVLAKQCGDVVAFPLIADRRQP